jgi:NAD+ kinase
VRQRLAFLEERLHVAAVDLEDGVDLAKAKADLVLVFGGDGSILHVARRLGANPIPVLGVNFGRFGYLADLSPGEFEEGIARWLGGRFTILPRLRLRVRIVRKGSLSAESLALNDVVVGHEEIGRMVDVDVGIDGKPAIGFSGDGLIVATSTGSTAHALAAGGPIVEPSVNAVVLAPIAPHALATRPLVMPASHRIELSVENSRSPARVTTDGAAAVPLKKDERVEIVDSGHPLALVHVSGSSFYDALRVKLDWRGRPTYEDPGARR